MTEKTKERLVRFKKILYFCFMKYLWLLLVVGLLMGCRTQKEGVKAVASHSGVALTPGEPHLLLLTGTIAYDLLTATYDMDITSQEYIDGYLNVNDDHGDLSGLHYVQLSANNTVLSSHPIDDPLRRDVEYPGETSYEHKVIILPRADFFLRVQLDDGVQFVEFHHGQKLIKRLSISF